MNEMKTNNGKRLLAAILAMAMIVCAIAVVMPSADAEDNGPISLDGSHPANTDTNCPAIKEVTGLSASNLGLGNDVKLTFTSSEPTADNNNISGTITVTGTLNKQDVTYSSESKWGGSNTSDSAKAGYSLHWEYAKTNQNYWLVISADTPFTVTNAEGEAGDADKVQMLMMTSGTEKTREITFTDGEKTVKYSLDLSKVTFSESTVTVIGDGNINFTEAQTFTNDVKVVGNTTITVTGLDGSTNASAMKVAAGKTVTIVDGATLTVNYGAASSITGSVSGIQAEGAMTIAGEGKLSLKADLGNGTVTVDGTKNSDKIAAIYANGDLTINVAELSIDVNGTVKDGITGDDKYSEAVYGIFMKDTDANLAVGTATTPVKLDITVAENDSLAFAISYGSPTYTNVTGQITGGNRGMQLGGETLTFNQTTLTVSGGEKAIQAKSDNSSVVLTGSDITLKLIDPAILNTGMNDRWGLKAQALTVDAASTLTTDGLRITGATGGNQSGTASTINGTLHVKYYAGAGLVADNTTTFPAGLVLWADTEDDPSGNALAINVAGEGKIVVDNGNIIAGKIVAGSSNAVFGKLITDDEVTYLAGPVTGSAGLTFSVGSLKIVGDAGSYSGDETVGYTITGPVEMSGTMDVPVTVENGASVTVPSGENLILNDTMTMKGTSSFNAVGGVSGSGKIVADSSATPTVTSTNPTSLQNMVEGITVAENISYAVYNTTNNDIETLAKNYPVVVLGQKLTIDTEITLPSTVTIYLNGYEIEVVAGGVLTMDGTTVRMGAPSNYNATDGAVGSLTETIKVTATGNNAGSLILNGANVYASVDADTENGAYVSLQNMKTTEITGDIGDRNQVGYGNTLNLGSVTISQNMNIDVFGTLNITGSVRIQNGGNFNVYAGGEATITGSLNIAGNVSVNGTLTVEGSVTMQGSGNDTNFTVGSDGKVDVASNGTVTVSKANGSNVNRLNVTGEFNVKGTLVMNGTLAGAVNDFGTIQFNGASENATVYVYDGVSFTVTSVTGTLTVSDGKAATEYADTLASTSKISEGNQVQINNAGGITVSTTVSMFVVDGVGTYVADMTVTGTITSTTTGTVSVAGAAGNAVPVSKTESRTGTLTFTDSVALGAGITMTVTGGDVYVAGEIDATAAAIGDSKPVPTIDVTGGNLTVDGTVDVIGNEATIAGYSSYVNGAYWTTQEGTVTIGHYATADAGISAISGAQQQTVNLYGETEVTVDVTIAAGQTLVNNGTLTVSAELTIADGAYFQNGTNTVDVDDTMVIQNYLSSYNGNEPTSDVLTTEGNARTYMSLAAAIESGATQITLKGDIVIEEDVTIPAGVTVTGNNADVTVEDGATLTVAGALELTRGDVKLVDGASTDGAMTVTGHVYVQNYAPAAEGQVSYIDLTDAVAGAFYTMRVNGVQTSIISSVEYAAENVTDGTVAIYGNVTADDITFTAVQNRTLTIQVINIDADHKSTLTVGTMTIVGSKLDLTVANSGTITGTVAVSADGAIVGAVDADAATGFMVETSSSTDAEGTTYYAYMNGAIDGDVTVSAGTVTVDQTAEGNATLTVNEGDTFTVASGATLAIASGSTVTVDKAANDEDAAVIQVDGTIAVSGTLTIDGEVTVTGTMDVASTQNGSGTVTVAGKLAIEGTLNVGAYSDSQYGKVLVTKVLVIGAAPSTLGVGGAASGNIGIVSGGYVNVYAGADIADVKFVTGNSNGTYTVATEAISTEIQINEVAYMTVYALKNSVDIYDVILAEEFALAGIDNGLKFEDSKDNTGLYDIANWYTNVTLADNTVLKDDAKVGAFAVVYGDAKAAAVYGTVSEGDGLTLYIDNVPISVSSANYPLLVGTHTVSFTVQAMYDGSNAVISFNGQTVENGGTITITSEMTTFTLTVTGATPATSTGGSTTSGSDDGMGLTDYLLIILVILIVVMAIMVAMRLMRS